MKETILDVLLYLFENYFYDDPDAVRDRDSLQAGLIQAGFSPSEVNKAFDWLDELARLRPSVDLPERVSVGPVRIFVDAEGRNVIVVVDLNGVALHHCLTSITSTIMSRQQLSSWLARH